jgi:drug/metabolite transporter (DMT)-like permease
MGKELKSWLLLIVLACIWGSSFFLMKRGMETENHEAIFSDAQVAALRMGIAGLVMLPFGLIAWRKINSWKVAVALVVVGLFGNFIPAFLFTFSETKLSSGLAGMLNSFTPVFTLLISWLVFKNRLIIRQVIGLIVAFVGMLFLVGIFNQASVAISWPHVGAIILATIMYGTSLNTIKQFLGHLKSWEITALAFTLLALPSWFSVAKTGVFSTLATNQFAWQGLFYIAILSVIGTCLALVLFNQIIAFKSAVFASSVTYFIPIVAVFIGLVFLHESFHFAQIIGMLFVISGVLITNLNQLKR